MVPEMFPVPLRYLIMFVLGAPTLIPFYSGRISPISFKNTPHRQITADIMVRALRFLNVDNSKPNSYVFLVIITRSKMV